MALQPGALDAIRRRRRGVHVTLRGRVMEAIEVLSDGNDPLVRCRYFCGDDAGTHRARDLHALERTYEEVG